MVWVAVLVYNVVAVYFLLRFSAEHYYFIVLHCFKITVNLLFVLLEISEWFNHEERDNRYLDNHIDVETAILGDLNRELFSRNNYLDKVKNVRTRDIESKNLEDSELGDGSESDSRNPKEGGRGDNDKKSYDILVVQEKEEGEEEEKVEGINPHHSHHLHPINQSTMMVDNHDDDDIDDYDDHIKDDAQEKDAGSEELGNY